MSLPTGLRVGAFEIVSHVGSGGMGDVYRARDTKLGRDVALKVLPAALSDDPDRVARFRREAQVLAALNHPHIAQIHGFEEADGVSALVLEYVDGLTLAERIAAGVVPFDEALPIARQIADAIEAAHEQGIVHRDLKPANIKLRSDGSVKVLDFGLAKALDQSSASLASERLAGLGGVTASPTMTSPAMTQMGVILGTAAYMSPEQAKGRAADKRSDVWAFGCVLYEMLAGARPFVGDDVSDTLAAVLRGEPDWSALPADVPISVRALIERCLVKDRSQRLGGLAAAQFVLRDPALLSASARAREASAPPTIERRRMALPIVGAVVATALFSSAIVWQLRPRVASSPVARFSIDLPDDQQFTTTTRHVVAISRDGTQVVYNASNQLFLRSLSDFEMHRISTDAVSIITGATFSPDGRSVAYWTNGTIKWIASAGGAPVTICEAEMPYGLSWDESGVVFGAGSKGIRRCRPNGSAPETLATVNTDEQAHGPQMLNGGKAVLFTVGKVGDDSFGTSRWDAAQIVVQPLPTGTRKIIGVGSDARYLASGHLAYAIGGIVFAAPFDLSTATVTGPPVPAIEGVRRPNTGATGAAQFAVSSNGTLAYVPGPRQTATLARVIGLAGRTGAVTRLPVSPAAYSQVRASRNGSQLAVASDDGKEAIIYIYDMAATGAMRRLTLTGQNRFPIWSPDGKRIAFQSDREGDLAIFSQLADGTGRVERLTKPEPGESHIPESWSPDGKYISFAVAKGPLFRLSILSVAGKTVTGFGAVQSAEPIGSVFSPDGHWLAYGSAPNAVGGGGAPSPNRGVYIQPFPATGDVYQVPKQQLDFQVAWTPDGGSLMFVPTTASGRLVIVGVSVKPRVTFGSATQFPASVTGNRLSSQARAYDVLPDGRLVGLISASEPDSAGQAASASQIRVVLNWFTELQKRVPLK